MKRAAALLATLLVAVAVTILSTPGAQAQSPCAPGQPLGRPGGSQGPPPGRPPQYPPGKCALRLSASVVSAGGSVTVAGDGYRPGTAVNITLGSTSVGSATTDASGSFSRAVTIPAGTAPDSYTVAASGLDADGNALVLSASLQVTAAGGLAAPAGTAAPAQATSDQLPRTGSDSSVPLGLAAAGLLATGAVLVLVARRRAQPDGVPD